MTSKLKISNWKVVFSFTSYLFTAELPKQPTIQKLLVSKYKRENKNRLILVEMAFDDKESSQYFVCVDNLLSHERFTLTSLEKL